MKKITTVFILLLLSVIGIAQEVSRQSKVTDVVVYRSMGRETRKTDARVPKGATDIVLSGVTTQMIDGSLQVAVKGEATLLSATVRINYFVETEQEPKDPKLDKLRDSIQNIDAQMRWITEEQIIHQSELNMVIELLKPANPKEGYKPADLNAMMDIYHVRVTDLKKKIYDLTLRQESCENRKNKFQGQLNEMGQKKRPDPVKEIVLSFNSEVDCEIELRCGYLVQGAGWTPMYDLYVENTSKPVDLTYKAKVFQQTGMDWKDVKLTISTSNPSLNNNRPLMSPKYIDYVNYAFAPSTSDGAATNMMQAMRVDNLAYVSGDQQPVIPPAAINAMEKDIQLSFELAQRQSIPSDGKEHICKMDQFSIPATYKYHVVPKLDPGAFLLARITDFGQYNLLTGNANVFFGENYVGEVLINPFTISDTMLVSLGRDERITVKRTRLQNKYSKKLISGVQKDTYEWEISVRNNKSVPIEIEVLDQVPLTRRDEIKVKMIENCKAEYNEEYGKILWNLTVAPNNTKSVRLHYTVEYPEGKQVAEQ
jgi:uncharacterized protein (TIGR02231 family)